MLQTMFGPYRIEELLGRGGMGEVYRAYDTETDRTVALKLLPVHLAEDDEYQARFRRECRVAARLSEPHVVPIHRFGEIDGRLYLDMRLVEGSDLGAWLREHGPMPPDVAVAVIGHVAQALDAAHNDGLVHRDVKPSNVLLSGITGSDVDVASVFAYLFDFGIARSRRSTSGPDPVALTQAGVLPGSPSYVAPERFKGVEGDLRADVYALGCVLHQALTAKPPFKGDLASLMRAHLLAPPPRPSVVQPGVPEALDEVVARGMAKEPEDRYSSAGELAVAARAALRTPTATATATELVTERADTADNALTANIGGQAPRSRSDLTPAAGSASSRTSAPAPAGPPTQSPAPTQPPAQPPSRSSTQGTGPTWTPTQPPAPARSSTQGRDPARSSTQPPAPAWPPQRAPAQPPARVPNWTPSRPPSGATPPRAAVYLPPVSPQTQGAAEQRRTGWIGVAAVFAVIVIGGALVFTLGGPTTGEPNRPIGTAPAVPPTPDARLLAALPRGFDATNCTPDAAQRDALGALSYVSCEGAVANGPETGTFASFASQAKLNAAFKTRTDDAAIPPEVRYPTEVCRTPVKVRSTYGRGGSNQAGGLIACYTATPGGSFIIWTDPNPAVLAMGNVARADGNAAVLYDWWFNAEFKATQGR